MNHHKDKPTPLDDFISQLQGELRVGGGATLDELFNLALAVRDTVSDMATTSPKADTVPVESAHSPSQEPDTLNEILEVALRKARHNGWQLGKKQVETPTRYTLNDDTYLKTLFTDAKAALETMILAVIGEDEIGTGKAKPGTALSYKIIIRDELRAEQRAALRALVGGANE